MFNKKEWTVTLVVVIPNESSYESWQDFVNNRTKGPAEKYLKNGQIVKTTVGAKTKFGATMEAERDAGLRSMCYMKTAFFQVKSVELSQEK